MAEFADEYNGEFDSAFLENLHLSGLTMPKLSTVRFVHLAYQMFEKWNIYCCRTHVSQITNINNPIARVQPACITMLNILLKGLVLEKSDIEKQLSCLKRREKLFS